MFLAGDIGGTKTVLALFEEAGEELRLLRDGTFPSQTYASLEEILAKFLADGPAPVLRAGCFGVAGAVIEGKCKTTNLPWQLDEVHLARAIGAPRAKLLNDLEAVTPCKRWQILCSERSWRGFRLVQLPGPTRLRSAAMCRALCWLLPAGTARRRNSAMP